MTSPSGGGRSSRRDRYRKAGGGGTTKRTSKAKAPRTLPIRVTLDLSPRQHADLKRWCNEAAAELDLSQVSLAKVLRFLGEELVSDRELANAIRERLVEEAEEL